MIISWAQIADKKIEIITKSTEVHESVRHETIESVRPHQVLEVYDAFLRIETLRRQVLKVYDDQIQVEHELQADY